MLAPPESVLVIAAHQDDETIGCGGMIRKWADLGTRVGVIFVTSGNTGIDQNGVYSRKDITRVRFQEADEASRILGFSWSTLGYPSQNVKNTQKLFHEIIHAIRKDKPDLVITHAPVDKHRDHRVISDTVKEACWKANENIHPELGEVHKIKDLWAMEILDLLPKVDYIVDITQTYESKIEAMRAYTSQQEIISGIFDHIDGMAKVRGYASGCKYGEAFMRLNSVPVAL